MNIIIMILKLYMQITIDDEWKDYLSLLKCDVF